MTHVCALCRAIHSGPKLAVLLLLGLLPLLGVPMLLRRLRCRRGSCSCVLELFLRWECQCACADCGGAWAPAHAYGHGSSQVALGNRRHARRLRADPVSKSETRVRAPSAADINAERSAWHSSMWCSDVARCKSMQELLKKIGVRGRQRTSSSPQGA